MMLMFYLYLLVIMAFIGLLSYLFPFYGPKGKTIKQRLNKLRSRAGIHKLGIALIVLGSGTGNLVQANAHDAYPNNLSPSLRQWSNERIISKLQNHGQQAAQSYREEAERLAQDYQYGNRVKEEAQQSIALSHSRTRQASGQMHDFIEDLNDNPSSYDNPLPGVVQKKLNANAKKSCQNCTLSPELSSRHQQDVNNQSNKGQGNTLSQMSEVLNHNVSQAELLIFVSSSMPGAVLQDLCEHAEKFGGKLVFRGLIEDSFTQTLEYFKQIKINADIDPRKFIQYSIVQVPTFVLAEGDTHDQIVGNLSIEAALEQFADEGELKSQAKALLQQGKGA